ncbi:MAG: methenyltetrahydrofolate cyclohydrolase, partial [Anaerolineaceae bacterium 4572_78]
MSVSTIQQFLKELASSAPTPGGGSTAALSGAVGASLVSMVCQLTIGKKRYADVQTEMHEILKVSEELQQKLIAMIDEDAKAFDLVMDAFKMPKKTAEEKSARRTAIQEGSKQATIVPMKVVLACARVIELG